MNRAGGLGDWGGCKYGWGFTWRGLARAHSKGAAAVATSPVALGSGLASDHGRVRQPLPSLEPAHNAKGMAGRASTKGGRGTGVAEGVALGPTSGSSAPQCAQPDAFTPRHHGMLCHGSARHGVYVGRRLTTTT